ncbi:MAG TPA: tetratricopeptide repeat protein [Anaerolineae bacterium]|nr:tetratricopeptide repeat protein [Anaerolineae bacterium]
MKTRYASRWAFFAAAIGAVVLMAGVFVARSLQPRYQDSLINRLPSFLRPAARSLILPDYPEVVPTPAAQITVDASKLLAPHQTKTPSPSPTPMPSLIPTPTLTPQRAEQQTGRPGPTENPTQTSPMAQPTLTPVIPPGPTQAARSTPASLESTDVMLAGFRHIYQTWNNCGPATLSMNLSFYGWGGGQADAAKYLKPDPEDKNVSPHEMAAFARSLGFEAVTRVGGSMPLVKEFLRAGIPVLIEKGFEPDPQAGWQGHYELIVGYDDSMNAFIAMDSYTGPNQSVPYDTLDWYWSHFNRTFIIAHTPDQAGTVMQMLGVDADPAQNLTGALATAQAEAAADPSNPFAWFNVGSNFAALGDYESAAAAYDQARSLGLPWRMTWYQFGIFEAYYRTGRFDDVLALADATLATTPYVEELWYYRGLVRQARGEPDAAREQFRQALHYNPNFTAAADALAALGQ